MTTVRTRTHAYLANIRTLCDELEEMLRASDTVGPDPGWMHPLRLGQEQMEKAVRVASGALGLVAIAPEVEQLHSR